MRNRAPKKIVAGNPEEIAKAIGLTGANSKEWQDFAPDCLKEENENRSL